MRLDLEDAALMPVPKCACSVLVGYWGDMCVTISVGTRERDGCSAGYPSTHPRERQLIVNVISGADIVINMVGKYYEAKALTDSPIFPFVIYDVNCNYYTPW